MTDNTQPEALWLADELDAEFAQGRISNHTGRKAATELRRQHARIAELESIGAGAGSEPIAWLVCTEEGDPDMVFLSQHEAQQYLEDDERPTPLYTHPSPQEGIVGGWISVDERLPQPFKEVVVSPRPDDYCCEAFCDMAGNWKWAEYEHNFGVHHRECHVEYWLMLPEVPAPPTTSAGSGKGE